MNPASANATDPDVDAFVDVWSQAWTATFGEDAPERVRWRQIAVVGASDGGYCAYSLWLPKKDVRLLLHGSADGRYQMASCLEQQSGTKGMHATANALWLARDTGWKQGAVLGHAILRQLHGRRGSGPLSALYLALDSLVLDRTRPARDRLPSWSLIGDGRIPWHWLSATTFPSGVVNSYDSIFRHAKLTGECGYATVDDICMIAAAEYALSSLTHDLVRIDIIHSSGRNPRYQPIDAHASQEGDATP